MSAGGRRPWSLQVRLVAGIVALLALVAVIIGSVSTAALGRALTARLDEQVVAAFTSIAGPNTPGYPASGYRPSPDDALRQGALVVFVSGGDVTTAAYLSAEGAVALDADQQKRVLGLEVDERPTDVAVGGELGDYRVVAQTRGDDRLLVGLPLAEVHATTNQLLVIIAIVTAVALVATAGVGTLVVRLALRPLGRVVSTATRVSELPLDRGEVTLADRVPEVDTDERTEVGKVGAALNRLLGHVASALTARESSERKVRQFVADASHELRTPLASIRGYAELTRRSGHDLPDDVVRSMARVESEAKRMTSLVEDLLLLARLDEGTELDRRAVDLSRIVVDSASDAHAAAPDHRFQVDVPEEPVEVHGDDSRLRQVVGNILANARVHTPPGTLVTLELSESDGEAILAITDDGPGIPAEVAPVLFERFARGDVSRSRVAGSTGLGLAIVSAIVAGHEGEVGVESAPGATRFVVRLPLARPVAATAPGSAAEV
ncbi:sensor histidine kinase [Marisediminicola sp. LYQ85]|uniref:sensor histidine kinase n=1 Tax=Marisediminicola sp. LYQ85 TaxID=3391062 RepID=UPI0039838C33